jgi:hypothetical protein
MSDSAKQLLPRTAERNRESCDRSAKLPKLKLGRLAVTDFCHLYEHDAAQITVP